MLDDWWSSVARTPYSILEYWGGSSDSTTVSFLVYRFNTKKKKTGRYLLTLNQSQKLEIISYQKLVFI